MKVFASMFVIMLITFVIHEAAHALTGAALGYDMEVSTNHAKPVDGRAGKTHEMIISAAGPAATALGALLVLASGWRMLLAFQIVFAAFLMRLLASGVSVLNPNDEMRISASLGWHPWALPAAVSMSLFLVLFVVAGGARPSWRTTGLSLAGAIAAIALAKAGEKIMPALTIPALGGAFSPAPG